MFEGCPSTAHVSRGTLRYDAGTPDGPRIEIDVRTADTLPDLAATPFVPLGTTPRDATPFDVGATLDAAGIAPGVLLECACSSTPRRTAQSQA